MEQRFSGLSPPIHRMTPSIGVMDARISSCSSSPWLLSFPTSTPELVRPTIPVHCSCSLLYLEGIASIFALAKEYDTTPGVINNLTSKYVSARYLVSIGQERPALISFLVGVYFFLVRLLYGLPSEPR